MLTVIQKAEQFAAQQEKSSERATLVWIPAHVSPYLDNKQLQQLSLPQTTSTNSDITLLLEEAAIFNFTLYRYQLAHVYVEYTTVGNKVIEEQMKIPFRDTLVCIPPTPVDSIIETNSANSNLTSVLSNVVESIDKMLLPFTVVSQRLRYGTVWIDPQLSTHNTLLNMIWHNILTKYTTQQYTVERIGQPTLELPLHTFLKIDSSVNTLNTAVFSIQLTGLTLYIDVYMQCSGFIVQSELQTYIEQALFVRFGGRRKNVTVKQIQIPGEYINSYMQVINTSSLSSLIL